LDSAYWTFLPAGEERRKARVSPLQEEGLEGFRYWDFRPIEGEVLQATVKGASTT
jgi:hypothetical protein